MRHVAVAAPRLQRCRCCLSYTRLETRHALILVDNHYHVDFLYLDVIVTDSWAGSKES